MILCGANVIGVEVDVNGGLTLCDYFFNRDDFQQSFPLNLEMIIGKEI